MSGRSHFVDFVRINARAGDGGHGCISFMSLKGQPHAGPDGGDGGRGGSIILEASRDLGTLIDLKMRPTIAAKRGRNGGSKNCSGRSGEDIVIKVPMGTVAINADTEEELGDLSTHEARLVVAKGGDGGRGNQHFATATNKAPRKADDGWPGEECNIILELKIIADAGFVGLPNAGKSTLLASLTDANPRIAPYPFTTLHPNLGVFLASDFQSRVTLADIPGLIEGAHTGVGLGHRFLRHIERTRILVHLVAPEAGEDEEGKPTLADAEPENIFYAYELINKELESYSDLLIQKPKVVCLNKSDLLTDEQAQEILDYFEEKLGKRPLLISAAENKGLEELKERIERVVLEEKSAP